jgi:hypothetical protein
MEGYQGNKTYKKMRKINQVMMEKKKKTSNKEKYKKERKKVD